MGVCRDSGVPHIPPASATVPHDAQELENSSLFGLCACVSHVPSQNLTYLLNPSLPSLPRSSLTTHQVLLREAWLTCGRVVLVRCGVRERDGI